MVGICLCPCIRYTAKADAHVTNRMIRNNDQKATRTLAAREVHLDGARLPEKQVLMYNEKRLKNFE